MTDPTRNHRLPIDRATYLLLAASIGSGCLLTVEDDDETMGGTATGTPATSSGSSDASSSGAGSSGSAGSTEGTADTSGSADTSGTADGSESSTGAVCDDDMGAPECESLPVACEAWQVGICNDHLTNLKPAVAEAAIACMVDTDCDALATYTCADDAVVAACEDQTAAADCETVTAACPSATTQECMTYLSGLTAQGRTAMITCMTPDEFCDFGFYTCLEGL